MFALGFMFGTIWVILRFIEERRCRLLNMKENSDDNTPKYKVFHVGLKISWVSNNISYPVAFVVSAMYWAFEYHGLTGLALYNTINVHAVQVECSVFALKLQIY